MFRDFGPDLLTTCGNPGNILSVDTTYVVGIGGPCSRYIDWTAYSQFSSADLQLLADNCVSSAATASSLNVVTLTLLGTVSYFFSKF